MTTEYVLYAFTNRNGAESLGSIGTQVEAQGGPSGVCLIEVGDMAAVVGPQTKWRLLHSSDYNSLLRLRHYQTVLEVAMEDATVLPARFQTVVPEKASVAGLLAQHRDSLIKPLREYGDLIEFEISIRWDIGEIVRNILSQGTLTSGETSGADSIAARGLEGAIGDKRRDLSSYIRNALSSIALDVIDIRTTAQDVLCHHTILLDKCNEAALFTLLHQIDQCGIGKVSTSCIGPLPPCSFASVELWVGDFEKVEAARRSLELDAIIDPEDIRRAYHSALKAHHPDLNSETERDTETISSLRSAFELLSLIADGQPQGLRAQESEGTTATVRLDAKSLQKTYLVSMRREGQPSAQAA